MGKTQFYRCEGCGNFVMIIGEKTGCTPKCCGETMKLLEPNRTDAAVEKHVPQAEITGDVVKVQVGSAVHPMLPEHHIQFIALETEKTVQINYLEPGEEPAAEFRVGSDKPVVVYEYCNLHGLWAADL